MVRRRPRGLPVWAGGLPQDLIVQRLVRHQSLRPHFSSATPAADAHLRIHPPVLRSPTIYVCSLTPNCLQTPGAFLLYPTPHPLDASIATIWSAPCRFFISNPFRPDGPAGFSHISWISFREGRQSGWHTNEISKAANCVVCWVGLKSACCYVYCVGGVIGIKTFVRGRVSNSAMVISLTCHGKHIFNMTGLI